MCSFRNDTPILGLSQLPQQNDDAIIPVDGFPLTLDKLSKCRMA